MTRSPTFALALALSVLPAGRFGAAEVIDPALNDAAHIDLPTYRFTARITDNAGVTPFGVGQVIQGTFTYDLEGRDRLTRLRWCGHYDSRRNSLSFRLGDLHFHGVGAVLATASRSERAETFSVVAYDLKLPPGWAMDHTGPAQSYGILLQNAPAKGALVDKRLPESLSLPSFTDTRRFRLNFFRGVSFPGGRVQGQADVYATLETLEALHHRRK
jgi:hypothetical protein